jgi:hypothetical protein
MKKIIKTAAILLILAGGFFSCGKENTDDTDIREIPKPISEIPINHVTDGMEFSFCLLNEKGEQATVFSKGENFGFYFKCTNNNANNEFRINNAFLTDLIYDGFSRVISYQNDTIGSPFGKSEARDTVTLCMDRLDWFPFHGENNSYEVIIPWNGSRKEWPSITCPFEKCQGKYLPAGKYYTELAHDFRFNIIIIGDDGFPFSSPVVFPVSFKIDFEIK